MEIDMTDTTTTRVRISSPGELLASLPALVGFTPAHSLVLVATTGRRISGIVRADITPSTDATALVAELAASPAFADAEVTAAIIDEQPHPSLVRALTGSAMTLQGVYQLARITAGQPWRSALDPTIGGTLPDPATTTTAVALTVDGTVIHNSREELEALFQPDNTAALDRRAALIDDRAAAPLPIRDSTATVQAALRTAMHGNLALSDADIANLAIALTDPAVRDACLSTAVPASTPLASAASDLWQALTRATPAPERAEPAALAGFAAYMRGDGATAHIALLVALQADPDHTLSGLLFAALKNGIHPTQLQQLASVDEVGLRDGFTEPAGGVHHVHR
jgi:hypothetical protein